ncbi:MAG: IS1634 family transposase, partial [Acetobacteraceae bacterium]|nr:IS1634 family transposase [Acetobacteraceae bacterium]
RASIVAPAQRSTAARRKAASKCTDDGLPVLSFQSLLAQLATFTRNTMALAGVQQVTFLLYPRPTPLQTRAFELLGTSPRL